MIGALNPSTLPRFVSWDERLHEAYTSRDPEAYAAYVDEMREISASEPSERLRLEASLEAAVNANFQRALDLAEGADPGDSNKAGVAYARYLGSLHRQFGRGAEARHWYETGMVRAEAIADAGSRGAIAADILELTNFQEKEVASLFQLMKDAPSDPASDFARSASTVSIAKEMFADHFKGERSFRFRSGVPDELRWHRVALAMAYLAGDFSEVRQIRETAARQLAVHAERTADVHLLLLAAQEFIAALASDEVARLLDRSVHLLHAELRIAERIRELRPSEAVGPAADPIWSMRRALIRGTAAYLSDDTRRSLTSEMLSDALQALEAQPSREELWGVSPMPGQFGADEFVRTFAEVGALTDGELVRLAEALTTRLNESLWLVIAEHDFSALSTPLPTAQTVLRYLTAAPIPDDAGDHIIDVAIALSNLSPDFDEQLDRWLLSSTWIQHDNRWRAFLNHNHALAADFVVQQTRWFVRDEPDWLLSRDARHTAHFPHLVLSALSVYDAAFATNERTEFIAKLLTASKDLRGDLAHKTSTFLGCAYLLERDSALKAAIRPMLDGRSPLSEIGNTNAFSPEHSANEAALCSLRLMYLRAEAGLRPSREESFFAAECQASSWATVRRAVLDVASAMHGDAVATAWVERALFDVSPSVRAHAVRIGFDASGLASNPATVSHVLRMARTDEPRVRQQILQVLARTNMPSAYLNELALLADLSLLDSHQGVRHGARALARGLMPVPV